MNYSPNAPEGDSKAKSAYEAPSRLSLAVRWFREKISKKSEGTLKEMIEEALEDESGEAASNISAEEKSLLINLIHFGELTVQDVMVPRSDIMGVERAVSLELLKQHIIDIGHTRIPIYEDSLDNIAGFIHVKDMFPHLASGEAFDIGMVIREILFVPPSMRIVDLLIKMRVSGCHIAIVVDEFGGTDGMVTMEDLFEEIVGEILDEHDDHESTESMRWLGDHVLEVDARTSIEKLEQALSEPLCDTEIGEDIDSLGGLIFSILGRVPVRGEVQMLKPHLKAEILQADPRRIRLVRITRITTQA
ncbi:MAG: hemolysin family protein [Rickettsiales bacterium]|nr:hemolysin family protein [Rickettsiales bacterium]